MKTKKSFEWPASNLDNTIKKLKNNKARDPHAISNEIFKDGNMGKDMKEGMLLFFNEIKRNMKIPSFMKWADITSIYKGKGSQEHMSNQRGIFGINVFKKVLDYLLYEEYYSEIDSTMTDSNIGGRKK